MASVIDVYPAEQTFWSLRFSRASGSAALAGWLILMSLLGLFTVALPFFPDLAESAEIPRTELLVSVVSLIAFVPLSLTLGVYLLVLFGRIDRRVTAGLGSFWLAITVLVSGMGVALDLAAGLAGDYAAGGWNGPIIANLAVAAAVASLQVLVLAWITAATWRIASVDKWSFASARGFTPTLARPIAVIRAAFGMPFYMAVGRQKGKLAASVKFALHNIFAGAFAIGIVSALRGVGRSPEPNEEGVLAYDSLATPTLASFSEADATWLNESPAFPGPFLDRPASLLIGLLFFGLTALITVPVSRWLGRSARKKLTANYSEARAADGRSPVLFLRSFRDDSVEIAQTKRNPLNRLILRFGEPRTLDEVLLEAGAAYGPVCAIGNPADPKPPFGAARTYVAHEDWQGAVTDLCAEAQAIVIVVDRTEGVQWEVRQILANQHDRKTFFLPSPALSQDQRVELARRIAPDLPEIDDDRALIAIGFADGSCEAYVSKALTRDAIQVALTRHFLERHGYPHHALARPKLPAIVKPTKTRPRLAAIMKWAGAVAALGVIGAAGAYAAPHWRQITPLWTAYLEEMARSASSSSTDRAPDVIPEQAPTEQRPPVARRTCAQTIAEDPSSRRAVLCEGHAHRRERRPEAALASYTRAIEMAPDQASGYYSRGMSYVDLGDEVRARRDFDAAIALTPNYGSALYQRGLIAHRARNFREAVNYFNRVEPAGDFTWLNFYRGSAYREMGELDLALRDAQSGTRENADESAYAWLLASVLNARRDYAAAAIAARRITELTPNDALAFNMLGNQLFFSGDHAGALSAYERAIALDGDNATFLTNAANTYARLDDSARARSLYYSALEHDPAFFPAHVDLAKLLALDGDHEAAAEQYRLALLIYPTRHDVRQARAVSLRELRRYDDAIAELTTIIGANDNYRRAALTDRASVRFSAGAYREAIEDFTAILNEQPNDTTALYMRGVSHIMLGENTAALADYDRRLAVGADTITLIRRGEAHLLSRAYARARVDYDAAMEREDWSGLSPSWRATALDGRAQSRHFQGDFDGAIDDADAALELDPDRAVQHIRCAARVLRGDRVSEAIGDCDEAVRRQERMIGMLITRAAVLYRDRRYEASLADAERALAQDPNNGSALYLRGVANLRLGRSTTAVRADIERGATSDPGSIERLQSVWNINP